VLIDWFTVGAQAVNFIILAALMKRFLYKPISSAIDAREKKVAAQLAGAAAKEAEATKEREELHRKDADFELQRAGLLEKATAEAGAARQTIIDEARRAADALRETQEVKRRGDAQALEHALRGRLQHEVFAIARKTLADLATVSLESRVTEVFLERLRALDGAARAAFADAIQNAAQPAIVRTAFELTAEQRAALQDSLNRAFSADVRVHFEVAPELVSGIELATPGQKLGWNILEYLGSLEGAVGDLLAARDHPAAKEPSTPPHEPKAVAAPKTIVSAEARPKPVTKPVPRADRSDDSKAVVAAETKSP
jgi:F-type H+-transporting ATPase subunit b